MILNEPGHDLAGAREGFDLDPLPLPAAVHDVIPQRPGQGVRDVNPGRVGEADLRVGSRDRHVEPDIIRSGSNRVSDGRAEHLAARLSINAVGNGITGRCSSRAGDRVIDADAGATHAPIPRRNCRRLREK
jgi:hypothetical protein